MKIQLSESGIIKEWKPLKWLNVVFARAEDHPLGKDYNFLVFGDEDEISEILRVSKDVEFYFFKDILYINIDSEPFLYVIKMIKENLKVFCEQIKKDKKITIVVIGERAVEKTFLYTVVV